MNLELVDISSEPLCEGPLRVVGGRKIGSSAVFMLVRVPIAIRTYPTWKPVRLVSRRPMAMLMPTRTWLLQEGRCLP